MTQPPDKSAQLSPVKRALLALEEMQGRLKVSEQRLREPLAVIGIGCRFPGGASDPAKCWELLRAGRDAVTEVPRDRWDIDAYYDPDPDAPGKMSTRWGGFLDSVDKFDPELFGISPREAVTMDPQQRLLLEVTWETLERAGQSPERLMGTRTGVYVGIATGDYAEILAQNVDPARIDAYFASGVAHSIASGRLSYCLGLQGPSVSIDTACSSSLVAVHQACASLRTGETDMAIAAGVNVVLRPEHGITFSKSRMMAADGRCKAFDSRADGFVRAEGCGVVLLKRLADAQRDGDPVLAVIRGTAINQDGASSGLTAPNGASQESLIRAALTNAGLEPDDVAYIEAHGTGTSLGDPIEVRALGGVFGRRPAEAPLTIGSAKTNFGHLESAAGIAGLIKAVLCLVHREIPPSLHFQKPNPHIAWEELPITVPTQVQPFPARGGRRIAGVSSFGFSGTNAHIVVEEAPGVEGQPGAEGQPGSQGTPARPVQVLALSAKSDAALSDMARSYREYLEGDGKRQPLADICHSATVGRSHFAHRLALVAKSHDELVQSLQAIERGESAGARGQLSGTARPKIAFLFTGQGAQYPGMGRELYDSEPVVRDVLDRCAQALAGELPRPLLEVMFGGGASGAGNGLVGGAGENPLDQTLYTQPALYALEVAVAALWKSWGVQPSVVLGHSVGEYAAACVAGVFSIEDGAKLIATRARLMQALPVGGGMLAVQGDPQRVEAELERVMLGQTQVSIAAYNAPGSVVVSGAATSLKTIAEKLDAAGLRTQRLQVSHAFHSPLIEPMLAEYERVASAVQHHAPQIAWVSNLTGELMDWARWSNNMGRYWRDHVRGAVRFEAGVRTAAGAGAAAASAGAGAVGLGGGAGAQIFVEVGPHAVLAGLGQTTLGSDKHTWLASLRRGRGAWEQVLDTVAQLYVRGARLDWPQFAAPYRHAKLPLPTYPFQRERYWVEMKSQGARTVMSASRGEESLLGRRIDSPALDGALFESHIGSNTAAAFALDHRVFGVPILPGTAYLAVAVDAASQILESDGVVLRDVEFREALALPEQGLRDVQLIVRRESATELRLQIFSRADAASPWTLHFGARALRDESDSQAAVATREGAPLGEGASAAIAASHAAADTRLHSVSEQCPEAIEPQAFYSDLARRGLEFGPLFRGVSSLRRGAREAVGEATLPPSLHSEATQYRIHPVLLDACVQVLAAVSRPADPEGLFLPVQIAECRIVKPSVAHTTCRARATLHAGREPTAQVISADVEVRGADGALVASLQGVQLQRAGREALDRLRSGDLAQWMLELRWEPELAADSITTLSPAAIADAVRPSILANSAATGWDQWNEAGPQLDRVCRAYIANALQTLGWNPVQGAREDTASLAARLRVKPAFTRLLERFLAILALDGVVQKEGSHWRVLRAPDSAGADVLLAALNKQYPLFSAEFTFVQRCGPQLANVLAGQCDPLQLLFPNNDALTAEHLYRDSPSARLFNGMVRDAVTAAVAKLPAERPLRILEVGGGTASTTAHVVPILPADRTSYLFTDVSPLFAARAAERFAPYGFVRAQALDIERDPRTQGIEGEFDIIIAANVLHATRDLSETMRHVRQHLAPGGLLVAVEVTRPVDWIDITFGLTDGWWRFVDVDLRPDYPLIDAPAWQSLLLREGFDEVAMLPQASAAPRSQNGPTAERVTAELDLAAIPDLNAVIIARAAPTSQRQSAAKHHWLVLADRGGIGERFAKRLREQGHTACLAYAASSYSRTSDDSFEVNPASSADLQRLLRDAASAVRPGAPSDGPGAYGGRAGLTPVASSSLTRIVHLWSIDEEAARPNSLEALHAQSARVSGSALHVAQALLATPQSSALSLWMVTRGGVALAGQPVSPASAALWGWARSLRLEHPELHCMSVDLDPADTAGCADLLLASAQRTDNETQIAWRERVSHVARIGRTDRAPRSVAARLTRPAGAHRLATRARGVLDNLYLEPIERRAPAQGEVEIRVHATGLNFRDVLAALDMYPGDQGPLGSECAGRITAVGAGVEGLSVGDEVIAIAPGAFASHVVTRAALVVAKPTTLTAAEAASLPNVFLTAHWALNHLGRMKAGERVLIHAGAGGVGLAAIQLAQRAGAEVFATAGNDEKRAYLRSLGVAHVFNSRTLDFAQEIRQATNNRGVDLVLNCLAGEFIDKSLGLVAPGGRFLEIGRTGIWTREQVAKSYPGIEYFAIDLGQDYAARPEIVRPMLLDLLRAVGAGELRPLPIRTFDVTETDAAFRFMAQARHIGKLVVTQPWLPGVGVPLVRADKTYWVTGGLSGLGLAVARWLVDRGARHLLLMGRRAADAAAQAAIAEFEAHGAQVVVFQGDVSNERNVLDALTRARTVGAPPIAGVVHAAGSLDNGEIQSQNLERYARVFAGKIDGAWLLDRATAGEPLDFFMLFSSVAALLGAAGQSNHAAANAFMDAFAHYRRAEGRPATSIQWGAWSEIGAAAGRDVADHLREKGLERIPPTRGLAAFEQALRTSPAEVAVVAADWSRFAQQLPPAVRPYVSLLTVGQRAAPIAIESARAEKSSAQPELLARLAAAPLNRRRALLQSEVRGHAVKVLGLAPAHPVDVRAPLAGLGLDSLMAVELRNLLSRTIARTLPATLLFDHPSVSALTEHLAEMLLIEAEAAPAVAQASAEEGMLDRVESLSEDELDRLLAAKMQAS